MFKPTITPRGYLQQCREAGYTVHFRGGNSRGASYAINNLRIFHISVIRGPDLPPRVLIEYVHVRDVDTLLYSTCEFPHETALQAWLTRWNLPVSKHARILS